MLSTDVRERLTPHRIPVSDPVPQFGWLIALDSSSELDPTPEEVAAMESYLDYRLAHEYRAQWGNSLLGTTPEGFRFDDMLTGLILRKHGTDDWGYRRGNWDVGEPYLPTLPTRRGPDALGPLDLAGVMDLLHGWRREQPEPALHWKQWKALHPAVFR